jgi:uncharacterized protein YlzI (FlbEa/FlbD family)
MIRLTFTDGRPFIANPELLEGIFPSSDGNETYLKYSGSSNVTVKESYEEIARKVLEYRLAMIDFQVDVKGEGAWARKQIEKLAGLEETNHD